jgi:hypothetical protein
MKRKLSFSSLVLFLFILFFICIQSCCSSRFNKSGEEGVYDADTQLNYGTLQSDSINYDDTIENEFSPRIIFNSKQLQQGSLDTIQIFISKDESYLAKVDRINRNVNNTISVRAKINEFPAAFLLMSFTNGRTEGVVKIPERNFIYQIKSDILSDIMYLTEINEYNDIEAELFIQSPEKP